MALNGTQHSAIAMSHVLGTGTLRGQLHKAVWDPTKLMPENWISHKNKDISAYFVAAFLLSDEKNVGVVVARSKPAVAGDWLSAECKAKADELLRTHETTVTEFDKKMQIKKEQDEELGSQSGMQSKNVAVSLLAAEWASQRPILTPEQLLPLLPRGVTFEVRATEHPTLTRLGIRAVSRSCLAPSRDGFYSGIVPAQRHRGRLGIVTWFPHDGLPSYPEVRSAVQARVCSQLMTC